MTDLCLLLLGFIAHTETGLRFVWFVTLKESCPSRRCLTDLMDGKARRASVLGLHKCHELYCRVCLCVGSVSISAPSTSRLPDFLVFFFTCFEENLQNKSDICGHVPESIGFSERNVDVSLLSPHWLTLNTRRRILHRLYCVVSRKVGSEA